MTNNEDTIISPNNNEDGKYQSEDIFIEGIEEEEEEVDIAKFEIFSYPADTTLAGYLNQWDRRELFIPDFQRNYVWEPKRASRLIESFLIGIPVPPIFLYKPKNESRYWIIDGQQRVKSIVSFMQGYFVSSNPQDEDEDRDDTKKMAFKLKGIHEKWNGKSFSNLDEGDKFQLENSVMRTIIIKQINENDGESIYSIFERLNTGGINLSHMEVRMCVAYGSFANFLKEINKYPMWRTLLDRPKLDKRYRDIEWILRVIALNDESYPYAYPMKDFLNKYMEKNANPTQEWLDKQEKLFKNAVEKATFISKTPFRIGKTGNLLNQSVMDSILVALMSLGDVEIDAEKLKNSHTMLLQENSDYFKSITTPGGTNHKDRVHNRIKLAKEEFEKAI